MKKMNECSKINTLDKDRCKWWRLLGWEKRRNKFQAGRRRGSRTLSQLHVKSYRNLDSYIIPAMFITGSVVSSHAST